MHKRRRQVRLIVTTAVGAVGAVLFYFLDPEKGSVRRAAARVWFSSMVDRTLDRVLAGPQPRAEIEQEPFPDLTPRVEQPEVQPEPAHDEPLVPAGVASVEAPAHISWPE